MSATTRARSSARSTHDGFVPIIDISPLFSANSTDRRSLAKQIDKACRDVGFYVTTGHNVRASLLADVEAEARNFFDLPLDQKMKLHVGLSASAVGYATIGDRALAYTRGEKTPPDLNESFSIAKVDVNPADPYFHTETAKSLIPENKWPEGHEKMRSAFEDYYKRMARLAADLLGLSAIALALPEDYFVDKIDRHISRLTLRLYPEQTEKPLPGQLRAGPHTDYGTITILRPGDSVGGLQVIDRDGVWHNVPSVPDSFVVNQGDLMVRWTNDRWLSNLHRVVNPPEDAGGGSRRLSIVFFYHPNYDVVIDCLPTCRDEGEAAKYEPIKVADYYSLKRQQQKAPALRS